MSISKLHKNKTPQRSFVGSVDLKNVLWGTTTAYPKNVIGVDDSSCLYQSFS